MNLDQLKLINYLYNAEGVKLREAITDSDMTKTYEPCTATSEDVSEVHFSHRDHQV